MASVQARHARTCGLEKGWSPFQLPPGCSCEPTYYVVVREGTRLHRERVGKNRRQAERALRKIGTQVDDGAYQPQLHANFADWAARWLSTLETKPTTRASYASTIAYATRGVPQDRADAVIRVRRSITDGHLGIPKNYERRDVDITRDLVDLLGRWWGESDATADNELVFPGDGRDGFLVSSTILKRELYPAMRRAGVHVRARPGPAHVPLPLSHLCAHRPRARS